MITKMISKCNAGEQPGECNVSYLLPIGADSIGMNMLVNKKIQVTFLGEIHCMHCGSLTKKSFGQGYCYPCFISIPETDACILRPELCQAHLGISRDMEWAKSNCLQEHCVYLAVSSGLKVGVTRATQVPTRWIDQGAWKAIVLARTPNRYLAGRVEVALKKNLADKTNWRDMLRDKQDRTIDLLKEKNRATGMIPDDLLKYHTAEDDIWEFHYPVDVFPEKVKSVSFDKEPKHSGVLKGIKGQYLIFEDGVVLNVRKHNGYLIELETD